MYNVSLPNKTIFLRSSNFSRHNPTLFLPKNEIHPNVSRKEEVKPKCQLK